MCYNRYIRYFLLKENSMEIKFEMCINSKYKIVLHEPSELYIDRFFEIDEYLEITPDYFSNEFRKIIKNFNGQIINSKIFFNNRKKFQTFKEFLEPYLVMKELLK